MKRLAKLFRSFTARPRQVASVAALTAFSLVFATVAAAQSGFSVLNEELDDSGVWVNRDIKLGRFNYNAQELDVQRDYSAVVNPEEQFELLQDGPNVFIWNLVANTLTKIDPATLKPLEPALTLVAKQQVALGGGIGAILAPAPKPVTPAETAEPDASPAPIATPTPETKDPGWAVWALPAAELHGFMAEAAPEPPVTGLSADTKIAVGPDGVVHAVDPQTGRLFTIRLNSDGSTSASEAYLPTLSNTADLQLTSVGGTAVVWDPITGTLFLGSGSKVSIPASETQAEGFELALQQPGPSAAEVLYATRDKLVFQPLDGATARVIAPEYPNGSPAQGVVLAGCNYQVWSGTGAFVRTCAGGVGEANTTVPDVSGTGGELRLRVNRGHVVLNQILSGGVWLITDDLVKKDNWEQLSNDDTTSNEDDDNKTDSQEEANPDRTTENHDPVAVDDSFGVRAGRTTLLRVLENDNDEDGDLLTASLVDDCSAVGNISSVYDGQILAIQVPEDVVAPSVSCVYEVNDGRGGVAQAAVTLEVHPPQVNAAPALFPGRTPVLTTVGSKGEVNVVALNDWLDPDGDDLSLASATSADDSVRVDYRADGSVTFKDLGKTTGIKKVAIEVSDGTLSTVGELTFDVRPSANQPPNLMGDLASGTVDTDIVAKPLANDTDPDGDPLRLTAAVLEGNPPGATVNPNTTDGTVTLRATEPGSYYVSYSVTDGPSLEKNLIRFEVTEPEGDEIDPVAVPDTGYLPAGGETLIGPLQNDVNPIDSPLVLTSATPVGDADMYVSVAVVNHEIIRVTERRALTGPVNLTYNISNGRGQPATGTVTIVPIPSPVKPRPPVAADDEVLVREDDIATVDVLANDVHPDNLPMTVLDELSDAPDPDAEAWVFASENQVRIHARNPGTYTVVYQVSDGRNEPDSAKLKIVVVPKPDTAEGNSAPAPQDVEARTVVGAKIRIPIPLHGIDPDGDSVSLIGIGQQGPQYGAVTVGYDYFEYDPGETAQVGNDAFTYVVQDRLGAKAEGKIKVGIAPREELNNPPVTVDDARTVQPERKISIPAAANDEDPDGDEVHLKQGSARSDTLEVYTEGEQVVFTSPAQEGDYSITYEAEDSWGASATGVITVKVSKDAKQFSPAARDDIATLEQVYAGTEVTLDILKNDIDLDGSISEVEVQVDYATAVFNEQTRTVTIPVTTELQIIDYTITDEDGNTGSAFIIIPGTERAVPVLKPGVKSAEVMAGESVALPLSEYIMVAEGKTVKITQSEKVSAWHGSVAVDSQSQVTFTADEDKYDGPASVTLEVTDAEADTDGNVATITIPITILPPPGGWNEPPTLRGAVLEVTVDKTTELDLASYAKDADTADAKQLTYALVDTAGASAAGLTVSLNGSVLQVGADKTAVPGFKFEVRASVTDGESDPVAASYRVTVLSTSEPMGKAVDDVVNDANAGEPRTVDVLANDVATAASRPLTVLSADVQGDVAATASVQNDKVVVTPPANFHGTVTVLYSVGDAFSANDPSRIVDARITLTVRDRPDPVTGVYVDSVESHRAVAHWDPAVNNGAPILRYTVKQAGGKYEKDCGTATTCALDSLTNNSEYSFVVIATNEVGDSDPSGASNTIRPDELPSTPGAPTLTYTATTDGRVLDADWKAPNVDGSPITHYELEISPAPDGMPSLVSGISGTTYHLTGLTNGTSYKVRVRACNSAETACTAEDQFSPWSGAETPSGVPSAPGKPSVEKLEPMDNQPRAKVCWAAPEKNNGAKVDAYLVSANLGVPDREISNPDDRCVTYQLDPSTDDYQFQVKAKNRAGWSEYSSTSAGHRAYVKPSAPSGLTAVDADKSAKVDFSAAANLASSGLLPSEVEYCWATDKGQSGSFGNSSSGVVEGLTNGETYKISVWAVSTRDGGKCGDDGGYASEKVSVDGVKPFGKPNKPGVSAEPSGEKQVKLCWTKPDKNGRDITIEVNVDGGGWQTKSGSDCTTVGDGYSQPHSIKARVTDTEGQTAESDTASATSNAEPPPPVTPSVTVSKGADHREADKCTSVYCAYVVVELHDFDPNTSYTIDVHHDAPTSDFSAHPVLTTNGSGFAHKEGPSFFGYPGYGVWACVRGTDICSPKFTWY